MPDVTQRDREAERETLRLSEELDITNADHAALWLASNLDTDTGHAWLAVQMVEAFARHRTADAARIAELEGEVARLREAGQAIISRLDRGDNAPGHGHMLPGVWDADRSNGEKGGTACDWCATWASAKALFSAPTALGGQS